MTTEQTLVALLISHGIAVLASSAQQITVEGVYCGNGQTITVEEQIPATVRDVKNWLGY